MIGETEDEDRLEAVLEYVSGFVPLALSQDPYESQSVYGRSLALGVGMAVVRVELDFAERWSKRVAVMVDRALQSCRSVLRTSLRSSSASL